MTQFVSLLPAAPAASAAAPAAPANVAPVTLLPPDLTSPNFLAQFKSALKNLANTVVLPQLTTPKPATAQNGPLMSPVSDETAPAADPVAAGKDKPVDANMPALLAELGFALVPPVFLVPVTVANTVAPGAAAPGPLVAQVQAPPLPGVLTPGPQTEPETHVQTQTPIPSAPAVMPDATAAAQLQSLAQPQVQPASQPVAQAPLPAPTGTPAPTPTTAPDPSSALPRPAPTTPAPASLASINHVPTATAPANSASPLVGPPQVAQQSSPGGYGSDRGNNPDHGRDAADKIAPVAADPAAVRSAPVSDTALVAAVANAVPVSATPPLSSVGPSAVVSQIARHADLIRLPGNRGLRIQLHPEDLGGVQVTVRYSPAGGVELHINAEHASTGALVQAGWTELRDSLASQGISADRLMLSVTGPSSAGQADLSGGGGNRSDSSSYSSNQSSLNSQNSPDNQGQGQSRQGTPQQPAPQGWTGPLDPMSSPEGNPRGASAGAAPSRIDYRV